VTKKIRAKPRVKRPRNYAATDSTLINLRAIKERVLRLEDEVAILQSRLDGMVNIAAPDEPDPALELPETTEA
jgi:hypothetical protein